MWILIILFLIPFSEVWSQLPTDSIFKDQNAFRDTVMIKQINPDLTITTKSDINIEIEDLFYDKALQPLSPYANLQHTGSPHMPILWKPNTELGARLSPSIYPAYDYNLEKISTFLTNVPYTEVNYAQALSQEQHSVDAFFARDFENSKFMIQFNRKSDIGLVQNEANLLNNLYSVLTTQVGRLDLNLSYISNVYNNLSSGGISALPAITSPFIIPSSKISGQLTTGQSRNLEKIYSIEDSWRLNQRKKVKVSLLHHFMYTQRTQRYYNTSPNRNYFSSFYVDSRGFRIENKINSVSNKLGMKISNSIAEDFSYSGNAGLLIRNQYINQSKLTSLENWVAIDAHVLMRLKDKMNIDLRYTQSIVPDVSDIAFKGKVSGSYKNLLNVEVQLDFLNQRPSLIQQKLIASDRLLWNNDFTHSSTFKIGAAIENPYTGLKAKANYYVIDDFIHFDTDRQPRQVDHTIQGVQFTGTWEKSIPYFEFKLLSAYQAYSYTEIDLPEYFSEGIITTQFPLFKNRLNVTTGPYMRYMNKALGYRFEPILGDFIASDNPEYQTGKYSLNYLLSFRVESFNFYAHIEDIQLIWDNPYAEISYYPENFIKWRVGIKWKLLN